MAGVPGTPGLPGEPGQDGTMGLKGEKVQIFFALQFACNWFDTNVILHCVHLFRVMPVLAVPLWACLWAMAQLCQDSKEKKEIPVLQGKENQAEM